MFKPKKRGQRVRRYSDDDMEIDEPDDRPVIKPKKDKTKKRDKPKKKATTGLSFGDEVDDEDNEFKIKKSSRSKKIAAKIRAEVEEERKENKGSYWGAANYSNAELNNLKISQNSVPTDNTPVIVNGDDLDKMKEKDLSKNSFREKVLDKIASSSIPDANAIHAARKKREEARRKATMGESYVPLNGQKSKSTAINIPGRRIDGTESDPDEEVIKMDLNTKTVINDDIDQGREKDDEGVRRWETNLIRGSTVYGQNVDDFEDIHFGRVDKRTPHQRIKEKLSDLKERLAECKQNKIRMEEHATADQQIVSDTTLEERYTYFQEMRAWLKDYTHFINSKAEEINAWHSALRDTQAEHASVLLRRRQLDVKDAGLQFTFNAPKGGNVNLEPDVQTRIREREARRTRRKLNRQMKHIKNHNVGESTDDELDPADEAKFKTKFDELTEARRRLFDDVIEDYTDSRLLLNRFNQWRESFPRWYKVCFVEECAGSVIMPVMKIEMNDWTPCGRQLEEVTPIQNAIRYSCQSSGNPELMLVPYIIGKYPLETISWWIDSVWDPMSGKQTKALVGLLNSKLWRSLPWATSTNQNIKTLLSSIHQRLSRCISEDVYLPLLPLTKIDKSSGSGLFFWRQWNACLKLISNLTCFSSILSTETVQQLILDKIINGQLLLKLNNLPKDLSTLDRVSEIVDLLPDHWFADLTDVTLPGLMSLSRFVAKLASNKSLYKRGKEILKGIHATEQLQQARHQLPIDSILG